MHSVAILHTYIIESEMQDLEKTSCLRVSCFVLTLSCHDLLNNFASLCRRALSHKKKKKLRFFLPLFLKVQKECWYHHYQEGAMTFLAYSIQYRQCLRKRKKGKTKEKACKKQNMEKGNRSYVLNRLV